MHAVRRHLPLATLVALAGAGCGEQAPDTPLAPVDAGVPPPVSVGVSPARGDFGNVVAGTEDVVELVVENPADRSVEVDLEVSAIVRPCAEGARPFCVRWADGSAVDRTPLAAGARRALEVRVAPLGAGERLNARFELATCPEAACRTGVELTGVSVASALVCRPTRLEFGSVLPGRDRTLEVRCENRANAPITLTPWRLAPGADPAFSIEAGPTVTLGEGEAAAGAVRFAPTELADASGRLEIRGQMPGVPTAEVDVPLAGTGGGPQLAIAPADLDFGLVALIAPARRRFVLTNVGFAPVSITEVQIDVDGTGAFSSPDAGANVLQPGESQLVTVEFAPRVEGEVVSRIRVLSNDAAAPERTIEVRGAGLNLPPCSFALRPVPLDFGTVQRTRSLRRGLVLENIGDDACLVTGMRLLGGSDLAFSLVDGDVRSLIVAEGAAVVFPIDFAPTGAGPRTGGVEVSLSSHRSPVVTVELRGEGADETLLLAPSVLDFGPVEVGCRAGPRAITVQNPSSAPVTLSGAALTMTGGSGPADAFTLVTRPQLPLVLSAGDVTTLEIGFRPGRLGGYADALELAATLDGRSLRPQISLLGEGAADGRRVERFTLRAPSRLDLLLVVDVTGGMGTELAGLASNVSRILQTADRLGVDLHVGVTTTDIDDEAGRLTSAPVGSSRSSSVEGPIANRVVTLGSQPSPEEVLTGNLSFTERGGAANDESGLRAATLALSPPAVFGHNAGFLRSDADLAVVFLSDEPDQSPGTVDDFLNLLASLEGSAGARRASASAIAAPSPPGTCSGPSGVASSFGRYQAAAERTGGFFDSVCTSDWAATVGGLATALFSPPARFVLAKPPIPSSLRVFVDGAEVPAVSPGGTVNWTYDLAANALGFSPASEPAAGVAVEIRYTAECR